MQLIFSLLGDRRDETIERIGKYRGRKEEKTREI